MSKMYKKKDDKIIFDRGFFERLYIQKPIFGEKQLTSLSLRLASVLLEELNTSEYRKLPSRTKLAKKLNVSNTAVNDSLIQLEEVRFLERRISEFIPSVSADSEEDKIINTRRFSDYFRINYNYNLKEEEILMDKKYTKEEIKTLCDDVAKEMYQQYHGIMTTGDLQSVAQFIQLLETKLIK